MSPAKCCHAVPHALRQECGSCRFMAAKAFSRENRRTQCADDECIRSRRCRPSGSAQCQMCVCASGEAGR